jgi:hypothetical protein
LVFVYSELLGEGLGQHFAYVFACAATSVLFGTVQVPVGAVEFSAGAILAAFLASFDVFESEIAFVASTFAGLRSALFQLPVSRLRALALDVRDHA